VATDSRAPSSPEKKKEKRKKKRKKEVLSHTLGSCS
jgi:hypothetical protein